ncbi:ATP-dependent nuclease [Exiguobacterium sp. TRN 1102]|uniref:ATP-dependent nuclease n=1 Tax=Exiguobacterium sp. TRN 1102 TaxID=3420732 RepID=UPI003D76A962
MKIKKIKIENFRNFECLEVEVGDQIVIMGENKIGKSNLLYALRLLLDPALSESARYLSESDFWDGITRPITDEKIIISIDITDFEEDEDMLCIFASCLVETKPLVARITYEFYPIITESQRQQFEFVIYGGSDPTNKLGYEIRKRVPFEILPALRDAESDLSSWSKSPLKPLVERVLEKIDKSEIENVAEKMSEVVDELEKSPKVIELSENINEQLENLVGKNHAIETSLGFNPTDPDKLFRSIKMLIDDGKRGVGEASQGSANLLYLVLKTLNLKFLVEENTRDHTFLAIEEPEAHLHPHIQRLVYKYLLGQMRGRVPEQININEAITNILTTHSPHIASVAPLKSFILLKKSKDKKSTVAVSTTNLDLKDKDISDLERYLNVTRGEILFAKGVILVEGDAEEYLIPILAEKKEYFLDELGISICSVSGTNFAPYVKLLGSKGLNIPYAILTDYDPQEGKQPLSYNRIIKLLEEIMEIEEFKKYTEDELIALSPQYGIFTNTYTFEIDLFESGRIFSMTDAIIELTENGAARKRAQQWQSNKSISSEEKQFLKDIEGIGKGRFAQRVGTNILRRKETAIPKYIKEAIEYVSKKV